MELQGLTGPHSSMASSYDARYQKTIDQLITEIRKRRHFIGTNWIDDSSDEGSDGEQGSLSNVSVAQQVRLLDYACGTGLVSRVSWYLPPPNSDN